VINKEVIQEKIGSRGILLDLLEKNGQLILLLETTKEQNLQNLEKELSQIFQKEVVIHTSHTIPNKKKSIPGIKKILLVASGKGGVGKSTIATLLAVFLAKKGLKVGLCDLDLHGPSIPKIFGLLGPLKIDKDLFIPKELEGIKVISMGLMIEEEKALVWRGPMLTKALHQFLLKSYWGELDYLILDSPPGTGDLHLSLGENYQLDGAILVSTPQEVALLATHRSCDLFKKFSIKILGLVGNQVFFEKDAIKHYLFGEGKLENYSQREKIPLLAAVPIIPELSESFDLGSPAAWLEKNPAVQKIFQELVEKII
jgi:ATP-binding protein involved in chromosome partitioning